MQVISVGLYSSYLEDTKVAFYCGFAFIILEIIVVYLVKYCLTNYKQNKHIQRMKKKTEMVTDLAKI